MPEHNPSCLRASALIDRSEATRTATERAWLTAHVVGCEPCRREAELAERVAQAFRELPTFSCPPAVTGAVLAQAEREILAAAPETDREPRHFLARLTARIRSALGRSFLPGHSRQVAAPSGAPSTLRFAPLLGAALVATLIVAGTLLVGRSVPGPVAPLPPTFSESEVEQAREELDLVFAYLGKIGAETETTLRNEVVDHVLQPAQRALSGSPGPRPKTAESPR